MNKFFISAASMVVMTFSSKAQKIDFTEYTLPNGLHVILHQDGSNPLVAVSVLYHLGGKNETLGRSGFAHFFEHLMFEGSYNIGRGEFSKYINDNGGTLNAYTTSDDTNYLEFLPSNQLRLALWLESERMMHAKVDQKGIDTQREVVKEEKRLYIDNRPYMTAISKEIPALLFKKHPYRFPVIGAIEDLNAVAEADYQFFYKTFYVPNNATLSIAGDIDLEKTKKWINAYFGPIPKSTQPIPRPNAKEDPITQEIYATYEDKNAQVPAVVLAYRAPKKTDKDTYVLKIIDNVLSKGESSRITRNVINKKQLASHAGSFLQDLEDYGIFIIYAVANSDSDVTLDDITQAIDEEIEALKKDSIIQSELEKQINNLENSLIYANASMIGIARTLAKYHVYHGNTDLINTVLEKYRRITVEDIKQVANKYLNKTQRVRLYNLSKKS
ncbi:MAG: pitrilysin family protein [Flavobacteriales bacterium]